MDHFQGPWSLGASFEGRGEIYHLHPVPDLRSFQPITVRMFSYPLPCRGQTSL